MHFWQQVWFVFIWGIATAIALGMLYVSYKIIVKSIIVLVRTVVAFYGRIEWRFRLQTRSGIERIATHEAGHALAMMLLGRAVETVTVIRTFGKFGYVTPARTFSSNPVISEASCICDIQSTLAGAVAERLLLGSHHAIVRRDYETALESAIEMVTVHGFGRLGVRGLTKQVTHLPQKIQNEISRILRDAAEQVHVIFSAHLDDLKLLRDALLERGTMSGEECRELLMEHGTDPKAYARIPYTGVLADLSKQAIIASVLTTFLSVQPDEDT